MSCDPVVVRAVGSNGYLEAYATDGVVFDPGGYDSIAKLDLDEWRATYPGEQPEDGDIDILDLGFWDTEGVYSPADAEWRAEFKKEREADNG